MFLVPGQSLIGYQSSADVDTQVQVLGPLPADSWLRRLFLHYRAAGASTTDIAFSVGTSSQANEAALDAGSPLIQAAVPLVSGTAALRIVTLSEVERKFVLPVGVRLTAGSSYLVWAMQNIVGVSLQAVLGLEVLSLQKGSGDK